METAYFPMFVDISAMKILIAGGGKIAVRRVKTLLFFLVRKALPLICYRKVQFHLIFLPQYSHI